MLTPPERPVMPYELARDARHSVRKNERKLKRDIAKFSQLTARFQKFQQCDVRGVISKPLTGSGFITA